MITLGHADHTVIQGNQGNGKKKKNFLFSFRPKLDMFISDVSPIIAAAKS